MALTRERAIDLKIHVIKATVFRATQRKISGNIQYSSAFKTRERRE